MPSTMRADMLNMAAMPSPAHASGNPFSRLRRWRRHFLRRHESERRRWWLKASLGVFVCAWGIGLFWLSRDRLRGPRPLPRDEAVQQAARLIDQAAAMSAADPLGALGLMDDSVKTAPFWAQPWAHRGFMRLGQRDDNGALRDFEQAGRLGGKLEREAGLAEVFLSRKLLLKAETHARRALRIKPSVVSVRLCLTRALMGQGRFAEAGRELDKAIKLFPKSPLAWTLKGDLGLRTGRPAEGVAAYKRAMALAPGAAGPVLGAGEGLAMQGKWREAKAWYVKHLNPQWAGPVSNNLALLHLGKPFNPKSAYAYAWAATRHDPGNPAYKETLGRVMVALGHFQEAIPLLSQALEEVPDHPAPRYFLAAALAGKGDLNRAATLLNEGLAGKVVHGPGTREAYKLLLSSLSQGRKRPALDWRMAG